MEKAGDKKNNISYMDRNSRNFRRGLTVTTFYLAKGLEFDRVYGIFSGKEDEPLKRQGRYITATRALHELVMYTVSGRR